MRLSTSTNLFSYRPDGSYIPILESISRCHKAGYRVVDINLCDALRPYFRIADDDWEDWVQQVRDKLDFLDMTASQSHTPFYNVLDKNFPHREEIELLVKRSIIASGKLNIPWIVIHSGTYLGENRSRRISKKENMEYFRPYLELAGKYGSGIAIENLVDSFCPNKSIGYREYSSDYENLCDLVDSLGQEFPNVGICWDFGHANLMHNNQIEALKYIGKRLKATHVADNSGYFDDHIVPFMGRIDWCKIIPVLREIEYEGDLTYEIHNSSCRIPDSLLDIVGKYTYEVGKVLLQL